MKHNYLKKTIFILIILFLTFFAGVFLFFTVQYNKTTLNVNDLIAYNVGVQMYDKNDNLLKETYGSERKIISINDLPDYVKYAFIDAEDKRFYSHNGYDLKRIIKATLVNLKNFSKSQGASTITQQLVKNTLLTSEKSYKRKIKEIMLAIKTEKRFNKNEILQMYLNTIYFGSNAYGIENASKLYFDKSANELSIDEVACLAGIIKSPAKYSPKNNPINCLNRRNMILKLMLNNNHISNEEYEHAKNKSIEVCKNKNMFENGYHQAVLNQACNNLGLTEKDLIVGEYKIFTYLDEDLQEQLKSPEIEADSLSIVMTKDGEIVAYQGNCYYSLFGMNRQPASLVKPILVYLPAFQHNILTPATKILDEKTDFDGYSPSNVGNVYHGWVSTRNAIEKSLNIPAVKALEYQNINDVFKYANKLNLPLTEKDKNLALALGCCENGISTFDILKMYSIFGNDGSCINPSFISKIEDKYGNLVYEHDKTKTEIFSNDNTYLMTDILMSSCKNGTSRLLGDLDYEIASKTGTAMNISGNTDLWNVASTSEHVILSWIGNANNSPLDANFTSSRTAVLNTKQILNTIYKNKRPDNFTKPDSVEMVELNLLDYEENYLCQADMNTFDRFKFRELFSVFNKPFQPSRAFSLQLENDFDVKLTNNNSEITFNADKYHTYNIVKIIDGKETIIATILNIDGKQFFFDNEINSDAITYQLETCNIFTKEKILSKEIKVYPNIYKNEEIINNKLFKNYSSGKKKWYV